MLERPSIQSSAEDLSTVYEQALHQDLWIQQQQDRGQQEVIALLETNIPAKIRAVREYFEVLCHHKALLLVIDLAKNYKNTTLVDIPFMVTLHGMCLPPNVVF